MDSHNLNVNATRASGAAGLVEQYVNIAQWNSQSLMPKRAELELFLSQEKIGICLVSETWLDLDTSFRINSYNIFRKDRIDGYGGVAIIVHKSIKTQTHVISFNNTGIEVICVKILNCKYLEHVVSVYCPSSVRTSQCDWEHIFSKFSHKAVVAGDFNAHHTNWSCKDDVRGRQILDASLEHNFVTLNTGEFTRIKLVNGSLQQTTPDITFATSDIAIYFDWHVTRESLGSDHLVIKYKLEYRNCRRFVKRRNFKLANWELYQVTLRDKLNNLQVDEYSIQSSYDLFIDIVNYAANKSIPMIKNSKDPTQTFQPKPYWTPLLSQAIAERRLALKNFRRNPTPDNLDKLQKKIATAQRVHRQARSGSWRQFCGKMDETVNSSDMWRRMRWMKGLKRDYVVAPVEKKEELLCGLAPDFTQVEEPVFSSRNTLLESEFSTQEFLNCLKKKDTAPGEDQITYSMIYNLPPVAKLLLLKIYNLIFKHALIPDQWRSIKVVPIPKPNNGSDTTASFRPISLISCICKIFHAMLCKRMEWFVESNEILAPTTSGFRKCQSCVDCLVRLTSQIQIGFSNGITTLAVFLDVQSAYNNVLVDKLVNMLDNLNIGTQVCKYLWSFLSQRCLKINDDVEEKAMMRWTGRGLAQGDPVSPLLFNIMTHKIGSVLQNVCLLQYADDFVLSTQNVHLNDSVLQIQNALNLIASELELLGLEVSPIKTQCCVFKRGRKNQLVNLHINNSHVTSVDNVRYLGIWLDKSLLWRRHINETQEKVTKMLNLLKILAGASWGIHPKHLRRLYIALIRSRIDFGSFLYDTAAKTHLSKLDKVQNIALRVIGGFIRTTPIHVMECELGIHPLFLRRQYLATKYCLKSQSFSNNITISVLKELSTLCETSFWQNKKKPLLVSVFDDTKNEHVNASKPLNMFKLDTWMSNISTNFIETQVDGIKQAKTECDAKIMKYNSLCMINSKYRNWHKLYTDGSKTSGGSGAAYYDPSRNVKETYKIVSENICIMSVELLAISEALSYIITSDMGDVVVFTDSRSSLQHIARCASGVRGVSVAYAILKKVLFLLRKGVNLRLQWIPAHIGIRGNEVADELAKEAIITGTEIYVLPEVTEILIKYRYKIYEKWKLNYLTTSGQKGIWYRTLQHEPPRIPWCTYSKLRRHHMVIAYRLRSGHMPLNKFMHLMRRVDSPNCASCGVPEDVYHLLVECVRSESMRTCLITEFDINPYDVGIFQGILAVPTGVAARALYAMIGDIIV